MGDDVLHLRLVPVARVRHHNRRCLGDCGCLELTLGCGDDRPEVPESGESIVTSAAITICPATVPPLLRGDREPA